ncbi:hypothetical protein JIN85_16510 [Luteolibacter pohnpeiensis]|uniref:Secreted protein n=1 Tax=Luteolibacter pohnpeiensis TaxID=454153 RepID=A0A934SA15_9BACT|nr:hypothetical protein [Luteolibacter pohnpeiensis]MBK1884024.1 hypothetical protein [Luteolibacter pohnpeiensis]
MRIALISLIIIASSFFALGSGDDDRQQVEHGKPGVGKIRVEAQGDFRFKGVYFVPEGVGLKFFYGICGGNGPEGDFGGIPPKRFKIQRSVAGEIKTFSINVEQLLHANTKDFELMDGDIIFAATIIF